MDFDINTLRGLATVFCMIAFFAVVMWAYSDRKRADFEEAANLPFQDDSVRNNKKESPHV